MTIPSDALKTYLDAGTDDPKQARAQLADLVDSYNTLLAHARAAPFVNNSYTVGEGVEISSSALRAKVRSQWGIGRDGNGLWLDVSGMAALSGDVDPDNDLLPIYDASGTVISKVAPKGVLAAFKDTTELTSIDAAADKVPIWDASAAALKFFNPDALQLGGWAKLDAPGVQSSVASWSTSASWSAYNFIRINFYILAATDSQNLKFVPKKAGPTDITACRWQAIGLYDSSGLQSSRQSNTAAAPYMSGSAVRTGSHGGLRGEMLIWDVNGGADKGALVRSEHYDGSNMISSQVAINIEDASALIGGRFEMTSGNLSGYFTVDGIVA